MLLVIAIITLVCIIIGIICFVRGHKAGCVFGIIGVVVAIVLGIMDISNDLNEPYHGTDNYTGSPQYYQDAYEYYQKHPDELR